MKHFDGAILRAVISVLLGIVLILWPAAAVLYIIMLIGAGFLLPGVISIVSYFLRDKSNDTISRMFPLAGLGSVLLGAWLILMPGFFVNILMFVLGGVLLIAGIEQFCHVDFSPEIRTCPCDVLHSSCIDFVGRLAHYLLPDESNRGHFGHIRCCDIGIRSE